MVCIVCREPAPEPDLTCVACRDVGSGWRPRAGAPTGWPAQDAAAHMELEWLTAAANRLGVPLPAKPGDLTGVWGHFVRGLDAYVRGDVPGALTDALRCAAGPSPPGFVGLHDHAVILRDACRIAIGQASSVRRAYRTVIDVQLPPLPYGIDFKDAPWAFYEQAVQAARVHDGRKCQLLVYKGICAARGRAGHPAVWFLKTLGKAVTAAHKGRRRFADDFDVHDAAGVRLVLEEFGHLKPSDAALQEPAWVSFAQALLAFDRQAWQTCQRRIAAAYALPGRERDHLERLLQRTKARLPIKKRPHSRID